MEEAGVEKGEEHSEVEVERGEKREGGAEEGGHADGGLPDVGKKASSEPELCCVLKLAGG